MEATELSLASLELNKLEALIELMFLAAYSDGVVQLEERVAFREQLQIASAGQIGPDLIDAVLDHIQVVVTREGSEGRLAKMKTRLPEPRLRKAALAVAARVAAADGALKLDEIAFIRRAAGALELGEEAVGEVLASAKKPAVQA